MTGNVSYFRNNIPDMINKTKDIIFDMINKTKDIIIAVISNNHRLNKIRRILGLSKEEYNRLVDKYY